jgi:hypothetical protein
MQNDITNPHNPISGPPVRPSPSSAETPVPAVRNPSAGATPTASTFEVEPDGFAFTSPYGGSWLEKCYRIYSRDLYGGKVVRERDFLEKVRAAGKLPEIVLMGNFIAERAALLSRCRELGVNTVHCEDGFFPHYTTIHADPLGFSWESSLTRMVFREIGDAHRREAEEFRAHWFKDKSTSPASDRVRRPYVVWPLQLIGDQVNRWDLNVSSWVPLLRHFRSCLDQSIQLVIKPHPRARARDSKGIAEFAAAEKNTVLADRHATLHDLVRNCRAVAGANSTALLEARLLYLKPAYLYARGWHTNHVELFLPMHAREARALNRPEWLENPALVGQGRLRDYANWFLLQLLRRQIDRDRATSDGPWLKRKVWRLSYEAYQRYGESVFE